MASGVDTEFLYRVRIVNTGVDCREPVCRHRFLAWLPLQKLVGEFFFDFGEGNFAGNLTGILWDVFGPTK